MAEANPMLSLEALTFDNAQAALVQGCAAVSAGETEFDLGGVKAADSSALALMLAWQRRAQGQGRSLKFQRPAAPQAQPAPPPMLESKPAS